MKVACLQLDSKLGDVQANIEKADRLLEGVQPQDVNLLVLPELAFTGYKFSSAEEITPFLETKGSGPSFQWARRTSQRLQCYTVVGYPEIDNDRYNSCVLTSPGGELLANYRKTHLFMTDETWASEGSGGFGEYEPLKMALGICMDLNPYRFEAPFSKYEFAHHILQSKAKLVVIPMAWLASSQAGAAADGDDDDDDDDDDEEPDESTLRYWIARLRPLLQQQQQQQQQQEEGEVSSGDSDGITLVVSNRTGKERGATYAGTSAVVGLREGQASIYGMLGKGVEGLLKVDV